MSTLMFDDGHDRLLVDGFFTRPRSLFAPRTDPKVVQNRLGQGAPLRAVLTAHAHHDHALDVATIAGLEQGAAIVGTPSVLTLMRRQEVAEDRLCGVADKDVLGFGAFQITAYYVDHGPPLPFVGPLLDRPMDEGGGTPAWFGGFADNRNLAFLIVHGGRRLLVQPSAGTRDFSFTGAQTVFAGVGRLSAQPDLLTTAYFRGLIGHEARTVVPIHWDRFTTPPGESLRPSPRFLDDIEATFSAMCNFSTERPDADFLWMDAGAALHFDLHGDPSTRGLVKQLCPRPS